MNQFGILIFFLIGILCGMGIKSDEDFFVGVGVASSILIFIFLFIVIARNLI